MNSVWELPGLSLITWLLSFGIVVYAVRQSFSSESDFLDKEFEKERIKMGSKYEYSRIQGGILAGILVNLLIITEEQLEKMDPSGRASYNLKYGFAFLLWLPTSWFMAVVILSYFLH